MQPPRTEGRVVRKRVRCQYGPPPLRGPRDTPRASPCPATPVECGRRIRRTWIRLAEEVPLASGSGRSSAGRSGADEGDQRRTKLSSRRQRARWKAAGNLQEVAPRPGIITFVGGEVGEQHQRIGGSSVVWRCPNERPEQPCALGLVSFGNQRAGPWLLGDGRTPPAMPLAQKEDHPRAVTRQMAPREGIGAASDGEGSPAPLCNRFQNNANFWHRFGPGRSGQEISGLLTGGFTKGLDRGIPSEEQNFIGIPFATFRTLLCFFPSRSPTKCKRRLKNIPFRLSSSSLPSCFSA